MLDQDNSAARKWMAIILIATALVYARSLGNGFVFDDYYMIQVNRRLGKWSFIWKSLVRDSWWFRDPLHLPQSSYYRPLQDIWFALNFHLFGLWPAGWHAAMVPLHLIAVWLAYRIAARLTSDRITGVIAAALFATMPVHAEAIVWAAAIPLPLAAVFELGAFDLYLGGAATPPTDGRQSRWRAASLGLYAGALLTHESAVVLPALVALHALLLGPHTTYESHRPYLTDGRLAARLRAAVAAGWPYALEAAVYLLIRILVLGFISRPNPANLHPLETSQVLLTIPGAIMAYLLLLAIPWRAGPAHYLAIAGAVASPAFFLPLAELAAICGAAFLLLRRTPERRLHLFCATWFLIALAPALNLGGLFTQGLIQDRYVYLPSFGVCVMAAALAMSFARRSAQRSKIVWAGTAAVTIAYGAMLFATQRFWHDETAMFTRCVAAAPDYDFWRYRLGVTLHTAGDLTGARAQLEAAVKLVPGYVAALDQLAKVDEEMGDYRAAENVTADWLKRYPHPSVDAYTTLATIADEAGDTRGAEAALKRAEALPGGAQAVALTRAQLLLRHDRNEQAEQALKLLLQQNPNDPAALATMGLALAAEHRYDDALAALERAASLTPPAPLTHYRIALILHQLGRDREARAECALVLAAAPNARSARELMTAIERGAPK